MSGCTSPVPIAQRNWIYTPPPTHHGADVEGGAIARRLTGQAAGVGDHQTEMEEAK